MRAVVYTGPREFSIQEVSTPRCADDEVVVDMRLAGVCGTDLHIHSGGFFSHFPLTPGHENVGIVREVGAEVFHLEPGQRVAIDNASACGRCSRCTRDQPLFCEDFRSLGVNAAGGFAEALVSPAHKVYAVDDLDEDVAVFAEPLACAVHGMDILGLRPGQDVLMIGSGTTGLLLAQLLIHGGAGRVTVAAPTEFKLALATAYGVDRVVRINRDATQTFETVRDLAPEGFDVAIDATGASSVVQILPDLVANNGTVLVYGMCNADERVHWSPYDIFKRQLHIKGSFAQVNCFDRSLAMLRSGRIQTGSLITHRFSLDQYGEALQAVASDAACLKAVVTPFSRVPKTEFGQEHGVGNSEHLDRHPNERRA
jgi:D-arabinitol dehydrogenase (NADP+)